MKEVEVFHLNIEDLKVYGFHGWYKEERVVGQWYSFDLTLEIANSNSSEVQLSDTINYESISSTVKEIMKDSYKLIEELAFKVYGQIKKENKGVLKLAVRVSKVNPPVNGVGSTSIVINPNGIKAF